MERVARMADAGVRGHAASGEVRVADVDAGLLRVAGVGVLAARTERQAVTALFVELQHDLAEAVDEVRRVVGRDADAVGVLEDALAPAVDHLAALVEHQVRVLHAREHVHVVAGVDRNAANLAPLPAAG
jgi:hypothetical protein